MAEDELTYKGGFTKLIPQAGKQASHYAGMAELLVTLTRNGLDSLEAHPTPAPESFNPAPVTAPEKLDQLCNEFASQPMLLTVHALVIAASRRKDPPDIARTIFLNMWRQKPSVLLHHLDMRWALSALLTFRIFGENEVQRTTAAEMDVLFSLMKLYESERLYSGFAPDQPFRLSRRNSHELPFGVAGYSLSRGDLDRNMLGRLWVGAEEDPVLRPLACHLLNQLNREPRGIFRRLKLMRRERRARRDRREANL